MTMENELLKEYETGKRDLENEILEVKEELRILEAECDHLWNQKEELRRNLNTEGIARRKFTEPESDLQTVLQKKPDNTGKDLNQYCPKCGNFVNGAVYCSKCGTKVN